jgi:hypothetical protein
VSVPSVQDILITYSVVLTSMLEFSDKIRAASENEYTSYIMKKVLKLLKWEVVVKIVDIGGIAISREGTPYLSGAHIIIPEFGGVRVAL